MSTPTTTQWRRLKRSVTQTVNVEGGEGDVVDAPPSPPPPPPLPPRSFLAKVATAPAAASPVRIEEPFGAGAVISDDDATASSETAVLSASSWIQENISNHNPVGFVAEGICAGFRVSGGDAVADDDVRLVRNSLYNLLFVLVAYYAAHGLFFTFFFNDELKTNIFRVYFDSFVMTSSCHKPQYIYDDTAPHSAQIKPILKNQYTDLPEVKVYLHEKFDDAGAFFSFSLIPISCLRSGVVNTGVFLDQLFGGDRRLIFLILFVISYMPLLSFVNHSGDGGGFNIQQLVESSEATITLGVMAYILFHYSSEFITYATKLAGLMKSIEKNNDAAVEKIITNNGIANPSDLVLAAAKNAKVGTTIMSLIMGGYSQFVVPILGCILKTLLNLCALPFFMGLIPLYLFVIANSLILTSLYRMVFPRHEDGGEGQNGENGGILCTMIRFIRDSSSSSTVCFIFNYAVSFMSLFVIFYNMASFSAISSAPLKFNMLSYSLLFAAAIVCRLAYHWSEEPVLPTVHNQERSFYGRLVDTTTRVGIFWKYLMNCKLVLNKPSSTEGATTIPTTETTTIPINTDATPINTDATPINTDTISANPVTGILTIPTTGLPTIPTELITKTATTAATAATTAAATRVEDVKAAVNTVTNGTETAANTVKNGTNPAVNTVKKGFETAANTVKSTTNTLANSTETATNTVKNGTEIATNKTKNVFNKIRSIFGH